VLKRLLLATLASSALAAPAVAAHPLTWATLEGAKWLQEFRTLDVGSSGLVSPAAPTLHQVQS
jgi:hypothetical protein